MSLNLTLIAGKEDEVINGEFKCTEMSIQSSIYSSELCKWIVSLSPHYATSFHFYLQTA